MSRIGLTQEDMTAIDDVIAVKLMDWHKHSPDSDEPEVWFWYKNRGITAYSAAYPFQPTQDAKAAMEVRQRLTELGFVWLADYGIGAEFVYRFTLRYRSEVVSSIVAESELEAQVLAVCEKRAGAWHVRKEIAKGESMSEYCPVIRKCEHKYIRTARMAKALEAAEKLLKENLRHPDDIMNRLTKSFPKSEPDLPIKEDDTL